jgi:energy-coupling factor transporter ATP-binding protein EcfA2
MPRSRTRAYLKTIVFCAIADAKFLVLDEPNAKLDQRRADAVLDKGNQ